MRRLFLTNEERQSFNQIQEQQVAHDEILLFRILTIFGNLLPILIAIGISLLLFGTETKQTKNETDISIMLVIKLFNNGSIPLVCYSIILSSIVFLLDKVKPAQEGLRKKVLAVAVLLLFINISIYTFLTSQSGPISDEAHIILFFLSLLLLAFTSTISKCMILLQKKIIKSYAASVFNTRKSVTIPPSNNTSDDPLQF